MHAPQGAACPDAPGGPRDRLPRLAPVRQATRVPCCAVLCRLGVKFVKKPDDGKMKNIAFIQDPDGYWIEIFNAQEMRRFTSWGKQQEAASS